MPVAYVNSLTLRIPKETQDPGLHLIRDFLKTEEGVCQRAGDVAKVLEKNKALLAPYFPKLSELIHLYHNLSINFFDQIQLGSSETPSIDDWARGIYQILNAPVFAKRAALLEKATQFFAAHQQQFFTIINSSTAISANDRQVLKDNISEPALRITRMQELCKQLTKYIQDEDLGARLSDKIKAMAVANNNSILIPAPEVASISQEPPRARAKKPIYQRVKSTDGKIIHAVEDLRALPTSGMEIPEDQKQAFLALFQQQVAQPVLEQQSILTALSTVTGTAIQQLDLLELAFKAIQQTAYRANPKGRRLFRNDFPYSDTQLAQISTLKQTYLAIVKAQPYEKDSQFEGYLERQYPSDRFNGQGELLQVNVTRFAFFIKDQVKSVQLLERYKQGIDRKYVESPKAVLATSHSV